MKYIRTYTMKAPVINNCIFSLAAVKIKRGCPKVFSSRTRYGIPCFIPDKGTGYYTG